VQILISHHSFSGYGGPETYALTIGSELQHLGHRVLLYSATPTGPIAETARERGLVVTANYAELPDNCDALIAQDAGTAMSLAARFPDATRLYVAHSDFFPLQVPPQIEGFCHAIVAMSDRVKAFVEALAYHSTIVRLRQPVDLKRFGAFPSRPADGCRRALLLGNYLGGSGVDVVAKACTAAGFELSVIGAHTQSTSAPEREIAIVDVVIGYGRCVVEALAGRRAAYVYGVDGCDGWVTPESYDALEADGFGGRGLTGTITPDRLTSDLAKWHPGMGEVNRQLAAQHHDAIQHATALTTLINSLRSGLRRATLTSGEEFARLVRLEWESWGRYMGALEELRRLTREIERQHSEIRKVKIEAHNAMMESKADAQRLSSDVERLEAKCAAIQNSTSWRVTRPLRSLKLQLKSFLAPVRRRDRDGT